VHVPIFPQRGRLLAGGAQPQAFQSTVVGTAIFIPRPKFVTVARNMTVVFAFVR